jgi:tRNA/tmRNA/rRNA uracil-C5-methylase (TrmA/RlmC/RlmD family)
MTPDSIFELIDRYVASAAVGAAMEHKLFWLLDERPLTVREVAEATGVPEERCHPWLEMIVELGLLDRGADGYSTSVAARQAVNDAFSSETWAYLAREARERFPAVRDLAVQLTERGTPWEAQGLVRPDYLIKMIDNPQRASEFTQMLYEVHLPLAEQIADIVPTDGFERLLDVGGGSGVVSLAMLRRNPELEAVVVDIANVCAAGEKIAEAVGLAERIGYQPLDFMTEDLPSGFDVIVYCDVGVYTDDLFRKFSASLNAGGRLIVVGKFGEETGLAHPRHCRAMRRHLRLP